MLTIFTIPKAFQGLHEVIQTNAIKSWLALEPRPEVILLGNDEGTAETTSKLGLKHIADIESNENGTPLVSSMFEKAQEAASYPLMCYINADIILLSDFATVLRKVKTANFLIIGQRHDLDLTEFIDFSNSYWESELRELVAKKGVLHPLSGIDYFIFNRGLYYDIPPFAVGRTAWDNWLVYRARKAKAALINATPSITAIHQNHDYSHHPQGESGVWKGPEALRNRELMGNINYNFDLQYATRIMTPQGMKRALSPRSVYFRLRSIPLLHPKLYFLLRIFKLLEKVVSGARPESD